MKKNTLIIIGFAIVLAVVAYYFTASTGRSTVRQELKDFAVEDTASVTKIFLANKTGTHSTLVKQPDGTWMVNNKFKARPDAINHLLTTIQKLEVSSPVSTSGESNVIKNLATQGTKVEIYQNNKHDKPAKVYYVGGPTQNQLGTFMILENSSKPFIMHIPGFNGYLTSRYFTSENEWRSRELLTFDRDDITSVELQNFIIPENSYKIINKSDAGEEHLFELHNSNGKMLAPYDTLKIATYLTFFENVQFEGFDTSVKEETKDSIINAGPNFILTITGKDGASKKITMYNMPITKRSSVQEDRDGNPLTIDRDRFYGLIDGEKDFVVLQYFVFEKILRIQDEFLHGNRPVRQPA